LSKDLFLLDVFADPQRLRFNYIGRGIAERYGAELTGKFVDEVDPGDPFRYLSQRDSRGARPALLWSGGRDTFCTSFAPVGELRARIRVLAGEAWGKQHTVFRRQALSSRSRAHLLLARPP
jgi:hypothetical protein